MGRVARVLTGALLLSTPSAAVAQQTPTPLLREDLRKFLQSYCKESDPDASDTKYRAAFVDLRGDGQQEVIVYLSGQPWCGSGGCSALVLKPKGSTYQVITEIGLTRLPIEVLPTRTNGWHDLGVFVAGGGIVHGYEAQLSFDGKLYPDNPTGPPAKKMLKRVKGRIVIAQNMKDEALYSKE